MSLAIAAINKMAPTAMQNKAPKIDKNVHQVSFNRAKKTVKYKNGKYFIKYAIHNKAINLAL